MLGYEDDEDFEAGSLYPPPLSPQQPLQPLHHGKKTAEVIHIVTEDESDRGDTISPAPPLAYIHNQSIPELVMEEESSGNLQQLTGMYIVYCCHTVVIGKILSLLWL